MTRPLPLALLAALALSGCISFGAEPPDQLLTLMPAQKVAAGTTQTVTAGEAITVLWPGMPADLNTTRVPVQATPTSVAYVKNAQWSDTPNKLFARLLAETIEARTGHPVLSPRQFTLDPGTRLSGQLERFGIDASPQQAVVVFDAAVARGADIRTRRFEARVPVAAIEAQAVGAAINQAANQVAAEVADWLK
ncbi:ABC transporter [Sphingomonas sp. MAH-20]|uniref:ABC transporter n=1 Tax=Sphingomonas horti TaxID=2682842 RepID=A0A6I4IZI3_9SPHN|nr:MULTISPECIES: ABC-type transport auxiliary lipoprotein family protein [Sphingomonas]MBA2918519.1 membrane integrity-associated transporter subunit PqiC [Sphingomonas sp. CGMCC 1.13658]MVO77486.1 ABC transporter [Sphingomonas horti]